MVTGQYFPFRDRLYRDADFINHRYSLAYFGTNSINFTPGLSEGEQKLRSS